MRALIFAFVMLFIINIISTVFLKEKISYYENMILIYVTMIFYNTIKNN